MIHWLKKQTPVETLGGVLAVRYCAVCYLEVKLTPVSIRGLISSSGFTCRFESCLSIAATHWLY